MIKLASINENRKGKAISKQTVANINHTIPTYSPICERLTKLAVIFGGIKKVRNHKFKLINKYAYTGDEASFWDTIFDILNKRYNLSQIKHIFIMGDGANWIKKGKDDLRMDELQVTFLLDKFHTMQSVNCLSKTYASTLRCYIKNDMRQELKMLYKIIKTFYDESRQSRMKVQPEYLLNNWNAIQFMYQRNSFRYPMESQIKHILASKISSVPTAYTRKNLKKLVKLLAEKKMM